MTADDLRQPSEMKITQTQNGMICIWADDRIELLRDSRVNMPLLKYGLYMPQSA